MKRGRTLVARAVAVALMVLLISSCDGQPNDGATTPSGALYTVGGDHRLCVSSEHATTFTEGMSAIANRGPGPVTIDRAEWLNAHGVKLRAIAIFQREDGDRFAGFGVWNGDPPHGLANRGGPTMVAAWKRRVPAEGATVAVSDDPIEHYLLIAVSFSGVRGSAGPVRLTYTDGNGDKGVVDTLVTVKVRPNCS